MRYLNYKGYVYKQSPFRENEFFAVNNNPNFFIILSKTGKVRDSEHVDNLDYTGTLYKDSIANVIEKGLKFIEEELYRDARDLITKSDIDNWIISVKQDHNIWYTRDICYVEECYDGVFNNNYFSINLADSALGENYDTPSFIDIYEFKEYRLYRKDDTGSYCLIDEKVINSSLLN